ncbi:MAG: redoxin family protein, partial [bacterium]|nr:redoxin family protein [bacterium]
EIEKTMDSKDVDDRQPEGETIAYEVTLERPNRLFVKDGESQGILVSNGKTVQVFFPEMNVVLKQPAPKQYPAYLDFFRNEPEAVVFYLAFSAVPVLTQVFHPMGFDEVKQVYAQGKYLGEENLNGIQTVKLCLEESDVLYTIWVDAGEKALIHQARLEMTEEGRKKEKNMEHYTETARFRRWTLDSKLPKKTFDFTPPKSKDLKTIASFTELTEVEESQALREGQRAPGFKLNRIGEGVETLAAHKGKNVVVLDFWASWCPPCRTMMPMIERLSALYQGKNVVFYSINQKESEKKINLFLSKQGFQSTILLDPDGAIGQLYGVQSIPHVVLVGKDGKVKKTITGLPGDFETMMQALIEKER